MAAEHSHRLILSAAYRADITNDDHAFVLDIAVLSLAVLVWLVVPRPRRVPLAATVDA